MVAQIENLPTKMWSCEKPSVSVSTDLDAVLVVVRMQLGNDSLILFAARMIAVAGQVDLRPLNEIISRFMDYESLKQQVNVPLIRNFFVEVYDENSKLLLDQKSVRVFYLDSKSGFHLIRPFYGTILSERKIFVIPVPKKDSSEAVSVYTFLDTGHTVNLQVAVSGNYLNSAGFTKTFSFVRGIQPQVNIHPDKAARINIDVSELIYGQGIRTTESVTLFTADVSVMISVSDADGEPVSDSTFSICCRRMSSPVNFYFVNAFGAPETFWLDSSRQCTFDHSSAIARISDTAHNVDVSVSEVMKVEGRIRLSEVDAARQCALRFRSVSGRAGAVDKFELTDDDSETHMSISIRF